MMRRPRVLIVGAGQAGLQLALTLAGEKVEVTVATDRLSSEILHGRPMSTQVQFNTALRCERAVGLDFWQEEAPQIGGLQMSILGPDGQPAIEWLGHLDAPAQSVDQRVKFAHWLDLLDARGVRIIPGGVTPPDLQTLHHTSRGGIFDLIVIATGKGELGDLFNPNAEHSPYSTPQRTLSVVYVHGIADAARDAVHFNIIPEVGECFVIPALTASGRCHILFFEGIPDGPLDELQTSRLTAQDRLELTMTLMRRYVPAEAARFAQVKLTDPQAVLAGAYTPIVCDPVGVLPNGGLVLGMADAVVRNDPIVGQGANTATIAAAHYAEAILARAATGQPFDQDWMRATFTAHWDYAQHVTQWSNAMLQPPPPHVKNLLALAAREQAVADRFANNFNDPTDSGWFLDPQRAAALLTPPG